ncbi:hypothetical protein [Streptomyces silvensis]|uniref:hypothetical protein n=1 Tax=Streptomyces silvensis TaxID=1765722 RepID=UPI000A6AD020|nr:hypothetical protein [Streptomyces silvensis]
MRENAATLGPLEVIDGRCLVGDVRGHPDGPWVEFRTEGLYQHGPSAGEDARAEGEPTPWTRIMLGMDVVVGRGHPAKGNFTVSGWLGGLPGFKGRGGGHLGMTLRHPYEDRRVRYERHPRWYGVYEIAFLEELLRQTVAAGEAHRLADADWLERVVGRLTGLGLAASGGPREAVTRARQAEGPAAP